MFVKATRTMRNYLQEHIPEYKFSLLEMDVEQYKRNVDFDLYANVADYNDKKQCFKVVRVSYPAEYYTTPRYLTTAELNRIFTESDRTAAGFITATKRAIEI